MPVASRGGSDHGQPSEPRRLERGFEILDGAWGGLGVAAALAVVAAIPILRGSRWLYRRVTRSSPEGARVPAQ